MARIISGKASSEDTPLDTSLRPRCLDDFTGQSKVKDNLKIAIAAAKGRDEPLDHILLYGPPGLGKTTLAY
ncbi:MAG: ATP-binding protein, partial [Chloroflexi bacterium]|nr:ATP-binding protein [Chloroflexota bacterium]